MINAGLIDRTRPPRVIGLRAIAADKDAEIIGAYGENGGVRAILTDM